MKIGLCLIVKNEAHIISRCLDSVKPIIDYVLISDTGSTDGTQETIKNWLSENNIQGKVVEDDWRNFAHNRSLALSRMREIDHIDYSLMIDADEILIFDSDFDPEKFKLSLNQDLYNILSTLGGVVYPRPQLISNKKPFRYEGVIHEFLAMDISGSLGQISGFKNQPIQDSNRNRNGQKYKNDAEVIEKELLNPEVGDYMRSRYTFYLAQSYKDCGEKELAIKNYKIRSSQGFWREEEFVSLYNIAKIKNESNYPKEEVIQDFYKSFEHSPHRLEPLYWIMQICRLNGWNNQGYMAGKIIIDNITIPIGGLFVEEWIYEYGLMDEFSICCFYSGRQQESKEICLKLLSERKIPDFYIPRIENNIRFCG